MKQLIFFLLGILAAQAYAQITITSADMPLVTDTVRYSTSLTTVSQTTLDTEIGPNKVWNYSFLVPDFQEMASFKSAVNINPGYAFSFMSSSYGAHDNDLNFSIPGGGAATDVYNFYTKSTASYAMDGRGFTFQGLPLSEVYTPKDVVYRFPMAYGNKDSSTHSSNSVNILIANLSSGGKRVNTVDGWGTLVTPYGSFNCLRVKSFVRDTDYISIAGFPITIPLPRVITEYKWLATAKKIPILEISIPESGAAPTIKYHDINRPELFAPLASFSANKTDFVTNTHDTCFLTDQSARNPNSVQWTITPSTFSYQGGTNSSSPVAKVFFTAAGTYTVKLKVKYNAGADDTTIVNYISVISKAGISELNDRIRFDIYPNPAYGLFAVNMERQAVSTIGIFDVTGKLQTAEFDWSSGTSCVVNCAHLQPGMYFVKVRCTDGQTGVLRICLK